MKSYSLLAEKFKSAKGFFITGTDTNIGKTFFATRLLKNLNTLGYQTAAIKPVSSGCLKTSEGLRNDDALSLQQASSLSFEYTKVNPYALEQAISPHLAARAMTIEMNAQNVWHACQPILNSTADFVIVEGAGGWLTPINENETLADFAKILNFPVIIVIGIRLGCLNHALLTQSQLQHSTISIAGWVANCIDPNMNAVTENLETLEKKFGIPPLEVIPYQTCVTQYNDELTQ